MKNTSVRLIAYDAQTLGIACQGLQQAGIIRGYSDFIDFDGDQTRWVCMCYAAIKSDVSAYLRRNLRSAVHCL
jgi:hypothetical protein